MIVCWCIGIDFVPLTLWPRMLCVKKAMWKGLDALHLLSGHQGIFTIGEHFHHRLDLAPLYSRL